MEVDDEDMAHPFEALVTFEEKLAALDGVFGCGRKTRFQVSLGFLNLTRKLERLPFLLEVLVLVFKHVFELEEM